MCTYKNLCVIPSACNISWIARPKQQQHNYEHQKWKHEYSSCLIGLSFVMSKIQHGNIHMKSENSNSTDNDDGTDLIQMKQN